MRRSRKYRAKLRRLGRIRWGRHRRSTSTGIKKYNRKYSR